MTFPYHRTSAPMLWVFAALALIEALAVHLFVALKWPWLAWPLTLATLAGVAWLVRWIVSMKRLPHRLDPDALTLHLGRLRTLRVPLAQVRALTHEVSAETLKAPTTLNLVVLAHPNCLIRVEPPLAGRRGPVEQIAFRVDEPVSFDAAMSEFRTALPR